MIWNSDSDSEAKKAAGANNSTLANAGAPAKADAFLGKGSKVVGTLTFAGPVEIEGQVEGEIISQDRLVVGESAIITAKIHGADVVVRGTVTGDIVATKRLALKRPAKVVGNISSSNLSIEEGVIFEGKCSMGAPVNSQKTAEIRGINSKSSAAAGSSAAVA